MKKITFSVMPLCMLLCFGYAEARNIGESEALQTAQEFRREAGVKMAKAPLKMVYKSASADVINYYVFAPEQGQGFTVVSGNDVAAPVLGYTESGNFDPNNIPPGLKHMLAYYSEQIKQAVADGAAPYAETESMRMDSGNERTAIEPLCPTKWDQDAPYWNLCPTSGSRHCYTGCVATAMAQAVYVFQYPEKSKGYATWNSSVVTFNRTYNWQDMLLSYSGSYSSDQGTAVAELMVDLGKSVDMDYSTSGSGAMTDAVPPALINNFSYDEAVSYSQADQYAESDWHQLMYYQLENGWPVIYGGFGTGYNGGHQFICDGYKPGDYFHINWGWGGLADGYFKLTALNPSSQGAGGNTSNFSTGCDAVYFVRKPVPGSQKQTLISCRGNFVMGTSSSSTVNFRVNNGKIWTTTCNGFINLTGFTFKATLGVRLINKDDPTKFYTLATTSGEKNFVKWSTQVSSISVNTSEIPAGTYYVYPVSKAEGKDQWERITAPRNKQQYVILRISEDGSVVSSTPTTPYYLPVNTLVMTDTAQVEVNHTLAMKPLVIPENGTNTALRYKSSNPAIATVDSITGVVTGISTGSVIITATTTDGSDISSSTRLSVIKDKGVGSITDKVSDEPMDVYTITGILVARKVKQADIQNLDPGIYVAGGKKYIVRK